MRIHRLIFLALGGCFSGGAVAVNLVPTTEPPHALLPRAPGDIKVVSTPPGEPFAELGFLDGVPNDRGGHAVGVQTVLSKMRETAGRWGCDYLLISSSTVSKSAKGLDGYGGVGYHGACLVLLDAAKSASFVTGPPVPLPIDNARAGSTDVRETISSVPEVTTSLSTPDWDRTLLFLSSEGKVYHVKPESRAEAIKAGWAPIGAE